MKNVVSRYSLLLIFLTALSAWGVANPGDGRPAPARPAGVKPAGETAPAPFRGDVRVITREEILNSGARTLSDLLAWLPGMRVAMDRAQAMPVGGAVVSPDQFSRVLIMLDGHRLNKSWRDGADQEWDTGFLENLKEIRVYSGPATVAFGAGALDLAIDLVTLDGADQQGRVSAAALVSANADRLDKVRLHGHFGNTFHDDGQYFVSADWTEWQGQNVDRTGTWFTTADRYGRKEPTWQVFGSLTKGPWDLRARILRQEARQTHCCGTWWQYVFADGSRAVRLSDGWVLNLGASLDHIETRWGNYPTAEADDFRPTAAVVERRLGARAGLEWSDPRTHFTFELDYRNDDIHDRGDSIPGGLSSTRIRANAGFGSGLVNVARRLGAGWTLRAGVRVEKSAYYDWDAVPDVSLTYEGGQTALSLRYAHGLRYEDTWWRVGSATLTPGDSPVYAPYIIGHPVDPEVNRELRLVFDQGMGAGVTAGVRVFGGEYAHLQGLDWEYILAHDFQYLRTADLGGYRYWGATGLVRLVTGTLTAEVNVNWHDAFDVRLAGRQLFVDPFDERVLYLSPLVGNVLIDWQPVERVVVTARVHLRDGADNAGLDYAGGTYDPVYDTARYPDTGSTARLDLSVRLRRIWRRLELQGTVSNALNNRDRLPLVEDGYFYRPRPAFLLSLRWAF